MEEDPRGAKADGRETGISEQSPPVQPAPSEWERFFVSRATNANAFIKTLRKGKFGIPLEPELAKITGLIVGGKSGFARLLSLLQAVGQDHDLIQESVVKLAELSLGQYGLPGQVEGENQEVCLDAGRQWLARAAKNRLSAIQRDAFLTFVLVGWRREALHEGEVYELLKAAFSRPTNVRRPKLGVVEASPRPTEVLLRVCNSKANLTGLLELTSAWRCRVMAIEGDCGLAKRARDEAEAGSERLQHSIDILQKEIGQLHNVRTELERRVQSMESGNRDLRTDFQHRLDETRGRLKGVLEGELSRWLQNAYEASAAEPPRTTVIQERLEMAIATIRRQVEWLRTSD
jgi:hypothetical protein